MRPLREFFMRPRLTVTAGNENIVVDVVAGREPVVHVHHHYHRHGADGLQEELTRMANVLEQLRASVARNTDATAAAAEAIRGISGQLRTALEDDNPEEAKRILDQLDANTDNLAKAVAESTPGNANVSSDPIPDDSEGAEGNAGGTS